MAASVEDFNQRQVLAPALRNLFFVNAGGCW